MKISVIGLGKLGLPFAFFLASHGNKILCYDKNKIIVDCWGLFDHIQKPFKIYNLGVNYKINNV